MQKFIKVIVKKAPDLHRRESPVGKVFRKDRHLIHALKSPRQTVTPVKIHAEANTFRTENAHHMDNMVTHIGYRCTLFNR